MIEFYPLDCRYYLQNELMERVKRRPHYSLRAFARDLEVSPAALSGFLNGRIQLSTARVSEISKKMKLSLSHVSHWLDLIEAKSGKTAKAKREAELRIQQRISKSKKYIDPDLFEMISRWEALALLELLGFEKRFSTDEMASYLGLKKTQVGTLLKTLLRLNLIYWNTDRWSPLEEDSFVGNDIPSEAIRHFHGQILKKAAKALKEQTLDQREFRSTIFSMRKKDLPQLKRDLNQFWIDQIAKYAMPNKNDAVYCFSTQLFDLLEEDIKND
ncbi:hypothetical protein D3C87_1477750 [compost metagenome]